MNRVLALALVVATAAPAWAEPAPLRVTWQKPAKPPALGMPSTLRLVVQWGKLPPEVRQAWVDAELTVLINLPPGTELVEGPRPLALITAPGRKTDPSGPWTTYQWQGRVGPDAVARDEVLAFDLAVRPKVRGENWVFTAALRARHGAQSAADNTVIFLTLTDTTAEFHTAPHFPQVTPPLIAPKAKSAMRR